MFKKEDAKKIETRTTKKGSSYKVFTFECIQCGLDINLQSHRVHKGTGLCIRCGQKGRPYEHILNELISTCKKRDKHEVTLTYEDFIGLITPEQCHYCSKKLNFSPHTRDDKGNYTSRAYQLDRKDNNKGYTLENVVLCCWECNRLKSDIYSYEDFKRIAKVLKEIQQEKS